MTINKLLVAFIVLYSVNSLGAIYKCTNANGRVVYSDTACDTKANRQAVELRPQSEIKTHTSFFSGLTDKIRGFFKRFSNSQPLSSEPSTSSNAPSIKQPNYQCDGRSHCSQMTSCDEATFFINHCLNTEMDGDNDGIPCESQWCL